MRDPADGTTEREQHESATRREAKCRRNRGQSEVDGRVLGNQIAALLGYRDRGVERGRTRHFPAQFRDDRAVARIPLGIERLPSRE